MANYDSRALTPAAFVLLSPAPDELLGVTRADGGWGLPGGKLKPGELAGAAAARELFEETGLWAQRLTFVYRGTHKGRPIHIFRASGRLGGTLRSSEEGVAAVVRTSALTNGPYGRLIKQALAHVRRACGAPAPLTR